jgi:hypothetical protein
MFENEAPSWDTFPLLNYKHFFNWTMTYRLDSDFPRPYGWIEPLDAQVPEASF